MKKKIIFALLLLVAMPLILSIRLSPLKRYERSNAQSDDTLKCEIQAWFDHCKENHIDSSTIDWESYVDAEKDYIDSLDKVIAN